jgi:carbonic anhydrase
LPIVACTDPRCTPEEFLGMGSEKGNSTSSHLPIRLLLSQPALPLILRGVGTEATIIRTAGARAQPALSTFYVLSAVGNLGKKGTIMVVGHTDCGLQYALSP